MTSLLLCDIIKRKGKIMKKGLIIKVISLILVISCVLLSGCFDNIKALSKIEPNGEYTFQQYYRYTYKGTTYSILENSKKYKRQFNLRGGSGPSFPDEAIHEDYIYVIDYYGSYRINEVYYNDAVVFKAHIKKPTEAEPILTIKKFEGYRCNIDVTDNLLIIHDYCYNMQIYDLNNLKKITSSSDQQDPIFSVNNKEWSYKEWDNKLVVTENKFHDKIGNITVIDENLTKYKISNIEIKYYALYNDYLLINYKSSPKMVFEYKTGKSINLQAAEEIIDEYLTTVSNQSNNNTSSDDEEIKEFSFNGNNYSWENITTKVERDSNTRDEYGVYSKYEYFTDLIITNTSTQEQYILDDATFKEIAFDIMNAVDGHITCQAIYSQNDELYFCYYLEPGYSMFANNSSLSIMFKYDEKSHTIVYIGFTKEKDYPPIVHKGNLIG